MKGHRVGSNTDGRVGAHRPSVSRSATWSRRRIVQMLFLCGQSKNTWCLLSTGCAYCWHNVLSTTCFEWRLSFVLSLPWRKTTRNFWLYLTDEMSTPNPTPVRIHGVSCSVQCGVGVARFEGFACWLEQLHVISVAQRQSLQARKEAA